MGLFRTILEIASRRVVLKRKLPKNLGGCRILVSPNASLRYWSPKLPACSLFVWAISYVKKNDVVWDIGANIGLFSFPTAFIAGPNGFVLSVEPDAFMVDLLQRSAAMLSEKENAKISVICSAVSNVVSIKEFCIAVRGSSANHLASVPGTHTSKAGTLQKVSTIAVTLDWLLDYYPPPDLVKIDVEGAEIEVLQGGSRMLSVVRPIILLECESYNAQKTADILHSKTYKLYDLDNMHYGEIQKCSFNNLCIPYPSLPQNII